MGGPHSDQIEQAILEGGGRITRDPATASAIIWLSKDIEPLPELLHPNIRWVQLPDAGVEKWIKSGTIDGRRRFTSASGCYGPQVAEQALTLMLACARRIKAYARAESGRESSPPGGTLRGASVIVIGAGDIGSCLIDFLVPLGADVVAVTRGGHHVKGASTSISVDEYETALPAADFVVLTVPSTPRTVGMLGRSQFASMKPSAYVVNVGRGDLIDTAALLEAVQDGVIAGAGLDVTDPEPLPDSHPFWRMPQVLLTGHTANPPALKAASLARRVRSNVERFVAGDELIGIVEMSRGY